MGDGISQVEVNEELFDGTELTLYVEASGAIGEGNDNLKLYKEFKIQMNCDDAITASESELVLSAVPESTKKVSSGDIFEKEFYKFKTGTSKELCKPKYVVLKEKDDKGADNTFDFAMKVELIDGKRIVELDPTKYKDGLDYTFWLELTDSNDKIV